MKKYLCEALICISIVLQLLIFSYYYFQNSKESSVVLTDNIVENITEEVPNEVSIENTSVEKEYVRVEIKGEVKKAGVYKLEKGKIINDLVKKAGGFLSGAYTDNINLSYKLKDEMVVFVYNKKDIIKETNEVQKVSQNACKSETIYIDTCTKDNNSMIEPSSNEEDMISLININTASKEELMMLSGIGEAKANSIITYRTENGLFEKTEDIMNVSGISQNMYDKIKNNITV